MKRTFLFFTLMFSCCSALAQQDSQFTQYMYNTININPAYAGSRGVLSIFGLHRAQWVGFDGAPTTNAFSVNTPLNKSNLGLGMSFINDQIGPTSNNTISADVSYTIQTSETYKLSFGLKASGTVFNLDVNKLNPEVAEPNLQNYSSEFSPNFGAGLYFHSDKLYFGVSVPNFLQNTKYNDNAVTVFTEKMTFYTIGGYVFDFSSDVKFKPAFLTKIVAGAPVQLDVSGNFMFYNKFMLGASYRYEAAISGMAGFQVSEGLFIGYGYDRETTNLQNYNAGSHEIFVRFELFRNVKKMVSPRFF